MSSDITREEVAHIADLARLEISEDKLDEFTTQLSDILSVAEELSSLDLDGVEPMAHPYPLANVLRSDVVEVSLDRDEVLSQAPDVQDSQFKVPPAMGEAP